MKNIRISDKTYNLLIGIILLWGFSLNAIMCYLWGDVFRTWNQLAVLIGYFVIAIAGIFIAYKSSNPLISFIGYNMLVIPVGVVLSIFIKDYETFSIINTLIVTICVTVVLIALSTLFPKKFLALGNFLFVSLVVVIISELVMIIIGVRPTIWDWLVAGIFCLYIGYDWAKAQNQEKTVDNAVDACLDLYLDIINLFIRLLSGSGKKKE